MVYMWNAKVYEYVKKTGWGVFVYMWKEYMGFQDVLREYR